MGGRPRPRPRAGHAQAAPTRHCTPRQPPAGRREGGPQRPAPRTPCCAPPAPRAAQPDAGAGSHGQDGSRGRSRRVGARLLAGPTRRGGRGVPTAPPCPGKRAGPAPGGWRSARRRHLSDAQTRAWAARGPTAPVHCPGCPAPGTVTGQRPLSPEARAQSRVCATRVWPRAKVPATRPRATGALPPRPRPHACARARTPEAHAETRASVLVGVPHGGRCASTRVCTPGGLRHTRSHTHTRAHGRTGTHARPVTWARAPSRRRAPRLTPEEPRRAQPTGRAPWAPGSPGRGCPLPLPLPLRRASGGGPEPAARWARPGRAWSRHTGAPRPAV